MVSRGCSIVLHEAVASKTPQGTLLDCRQSLYIVHYRVLEEGDREM
jgi:hypothetical protein